MMDPRIEGMKFMLKDVNTIIPVVSGKGGVGKSLVSTTMALILSNKGCRVGLLDLDFHGASDHIILGVSLDEFPEEEKGIIPPKVHGIKFMTIAYYSKDMPVPLRGEEITDAILEILSVTRWEELDYLVIDMPPGLGDPFLDTIRFLRKGKYLAVTAPSKLSLDVLRRLLTVLKEQNLEVLGVIENMVMDKDASYSLNEILEIFKVKYLGSIRFDPEVEKSIGNPESLLRTNFSKDLLHVLQDAGII